MRAIPQSLLEKIKKQNQTIYEGAEPKMSVAVARARSSIMDATYFTVETIRQKEGLGDIALAIRRMKPYGYPDRIYEIHIDNGIAKTAYREYPDKLKQGWKTGFDLEAARSVAIAFDGRWELSNRKVWQPVTDEKPYIFWVTTAGDLYVQLWDKAETKIKLAEGTAKVSSIRGWKSTNGVLTDQGVVCAYIKTDGKVYYRNFCEQHNGSFMWEYEKEITQLMPAITNINLFRTNDYRIGIAVEKTNGSITWLITARSWSGMANTPESIAVGLKDFTINVIPIGYHQTHNNEHITVGLTDFYIGCAKPIYPEIVSITNTKGDTTHLLVKFSHEITQDLEGHEDAFMLKDSLNKDYEVLGTAEGEDKTEMVLTVDNFASAKNDMYLTYDNGVKGDNLVPRLTCNNEGVEFAIESGIIQFTADIEPPEGYENEYITVGLTDFTISVKKINYKDAFGNENISVGLTDFAIVVTQVGDKPL